MWERLSAVWKSNELQTDLIKAMEDDDGYSDADDDKSGDNVVDCQVVFLPKKEKEN